MQPHEVLGVSPRATAAEVTDAFRRYALRHHPDHGGDSGRFQDGMDAYRSLIRPAPISVARPHRVGPDVVFHRRTRSGVACLLRMAGRRLAAHRSRS